MTRAAELERKINTAMRKQELCKGMAQRITPSLSSDRVSHTRNITASEDMGMDEFSNAGAYIRGRE